MKRIAVAALMTILMMSWLVPAAAASDDDWCDIDPVVVITTPAGNTVAIYNTDGVKGTLHQAAILAAQTSYTVRPTADGEGTVVAMNVTVPNDQFGSGFPTRATISTGPWGTLDVLAISTGVSGQAMTLQFTLGVR